MKTYEVSVKLNKRERPKGIFNAASRADLDKQIEQKRFWKANKDRLTVREIEPCRPSRR